MKKLLFTLTLCGLFVAGGAMAQETESPTKKFSVETNSFWDNWFVSLGADYHAIYSSEQIPESKAQPFTLQRGSFGFTAAIGKWFTPVIGLRTKFDGIWAKQYISRSDNSTFRYFNLHEDVMMNLSNQFFGYNENRVWNFIPYVGFGVIHNMTGDNHNYDFSYNVGILNNFRVTKHWTIFFEVYATIAAGSFDAASTDNWADHQKHRARYWDKLVGAQVGVTYNFGKNTCVWEKTPDVAAIRAMYDEKIAALEAQIRDLQEENARLKKMLEECQNRPPKVVEKVVDNTQIVGTASVFFNVNSSKIASRKDLVNVQSMVDYAKENGKTITVTGFADSKTGTPEYNQTLSEKRAQAVADEIVSMGLDSESVVINAEGGVDTLSPYTYNRRVLVEIK